jgi:hypothetical protein
MKKGEHRQTHHQEEEEEKRSTTSPSSSSSSSVGNQRIRNPNPNQRHLQRQKSLQHFNFFHLASVASSTTTTTPCSQVFSLS